MPALPAQGAGAKEVMSFFVTLWKILIATFLFFQFAFFVDLKFSLLQPDSVTSVILDIGDDNKEIASHKTNNVGGDVMTLGTLARYKLEKSPLFLPPSNFSNIKVVIIIWGSSSQVVQPAAAALTPGDGIE